jgi:hypothetical protein
MATLGHFFVNGTTHPTAAGDPVFGQMYVEHMIPARLTSPWPIVMVHGAFQTGANFTGTPDGREGWGSFSSGAVTSSTWWIRWDVADWRTGMVSTPQ